ncbi:MAG TPA: hypothetical protein VNN20_13445 [Thermodesulfobacteriota bacterium]|nr:hypothetical protein [Thermodesulfobacteriota bacterium]
MEKLLQKSLLSSYSLFGLALASILGSLYSDPIFLRNLFLALGSLLFLIAILRLNSQNREQEPNTRFTTSTDWGIIDLSVEETNKRTILSLTVKELILWLLLLASFFSLFLLVFYPRRYDLLSREDYIVETVTATLLFISCGIFIRIMAKLMHFYKPSNIFVITTLVLALILFLDGMEEVSWFQRVFNIKTPQEFSGNVQGELNIHNFATGFSHKAYFFGAFCLFIFLPFLKAETSLLGKKIFSFFLPSRFLIFTGTLFMAYDFDAYFSNPLPQFTYLVTLFILIYYTWRLRSVDMTFLLPILVIYYLLAPFVFSNFAFQLGVNAWRIGEYKELSISVCFLLYSLEILSKGKPLESIDLPKSTWS